MILVLARPVVAAQQRHPFRATYLLHAREAAQLAHQALPVALVVGNERHEVLRPVAHGRLQHVDDLPDHHDGDGDHRNRDHVLEGDEHFAEHHLHARPQRAAHHLDGLGGRDDRGR